MKADRRLENILVTGGAGFIGSNFITYLFENNDFHGKVINLDKLTYAGCRENLTNIEEKYGGSRYKFFQSDICNVAEVKEIIDKEEVDTVVHFAAESHVDRSITGPSEFIKTNILGTFTLIDLFRFYWKGRKDAIFYHISTDEVYGSLGEAGSFSETSPYDPKSPYSASKASSDHLVRSYVNTYNFPAVISNCSNNYGPYQYPEKLIPLMIKNALDGKKLPVYGDGKNVRDWLYVKDHCSAIWQILKFGKLGETYNIGGENEIRNIDLVKMICRRLDAIFPVSSNPVFLEKKSPIKSYIELISFVKDRPGHDWRYAINCKKIKKELNWSRKFDFEEGLNLTIDWYFDKYKNQN